MRRADDFLDSRLQIAQMAPGKFLDRVCRLDPENVDRAMNADPIQQRQGYRRQSVILGRCSIEPTDKARVADAIAALPGLGQDPFQALWLVCQVIHGVVRFAELSQYRFAFLVWAVGEINPPDRA